METRNFQFLITGVFIGVILIFIGTWFQSPPCRNCFLNYYANIYLVIPLLGGLLGFIHLQHLRRSIFNSYGFVVFLFCVGLIIWSIGNMVWMYYNLILKIAVPYPSYADFFFFSGLVLWILGTFVLYKAVGTNPLREITLLPVLLTIGHAITWLKVVVQGENPITIDPPEKLIKGILDIAYSIGDSLCLFLVAAFILGQPLKKVDCKLHGAIYFICTGMVFLLIADFAFTFTTSLPLSHPLAHYNGNWVDFFYALAFYFLSMGILFFPLLVDQAKGRANYALEPTT